jgi:hypothetical protein
MEDSIIPGTSFKRGDIVWAKIAGYPWWPGEVVGSRQDKKSFSLAVNFIGDKSHAYLPISKVMEYKANREKNMKTKRKDLLEAIRMADSKVDEESTIKSSDESKTTRKRKHKNSSTEESTAAVKTSKKIKTLEDAGRWLEQLVNSGKLKESSVSNNLLICLDVIKEKVVECERVLETRIGINLNKLMEYYEEYTEYEDLVKKIQNILEALKSTVLRKYFESDLNFKKSKNSVELVRQSEREEAKACSSVEREESMQMKEDHPMEGSQESESFRMSGAQQIANFELQSNVCQEIARLIEEVPLTST